MAANSKSQCFIKQTFRSITYSKLLIHAAIPFFAISFIAASPSKAADSNQKRSDKATHTILLGMTNSWLCNRFSPARFQRLLKDQLPYVLPKQREFLLTEAATKKISGPIAALIPAMQGLIDTPADILSAAVVVIACNKETLQDDDVDIIRLLCAAKAPMNTWARTDDPQMERIATDLPLTALIKRAPKPGRNHIVAAQLLIQSGADVNQPYENARHHNGKPVKQFPLHAAVQSNSSEWVFELLLHGANPEVMDTYGKKPGQLVPTDGKFNNMHIGLGQLQIHMAKCRKAYMDAAKNHPHELAQLVLTYLVHHSAICSSTGSSAYSN